MIYPSDCIQLIEVDQLDDPLAANYCLGCTPIVNTFESITRITINHSTMLSESLPSASSCRCC